MSCLIKTVTKVAFLIFFIIAVAQMKRKIRKLYLDDTDLIPPWTGRGFFLDLFFVVIVIPVRGPKNKSTNEGSGFLKFSYLLSI